MTQTPPPFISAFLRARCVRRTPDLIPKKLHPGILPEALIPWTDFIRAVWSLPAGWAMTGEMPQGVSPHQFWARVYRAANRLGGKVEIVVRGEVFWVWGEEPGKEEKAKVKMGPRGPMPNRGWAGELLTRMRDGEPVRMERELGRAERRRLRDLARQRGWRIHIETQGMGVDEQGVPKIVSVVQWIGEIGR
jgi:hypothetical protein